MKGSRKVEEDIAEVSEKSAMVVKAKCDSCGTSFNSEQELSENVHKEMQHYML